MLKKLRMIVASLFFIGLTLLFLDVSGSLHRWLGWMAHIQFLPAVMALHLGIVAVLALLTLLFGRIYCSVICPLGIMQDIFTWFATRKNKHKFRYTKPRSLLRYAVLGIFIVLMLLPVSSVALLIAPYSAYGRIAQNLFAPVYQLGNNLLAYFAERAESYAFYSVDIWIRSLSTGVIALLTFILLGFLAWRGGRTWCNTVCPVGTLLGILSRFSWFRPVIDTAKCTGCKACEKRCKASCIDIATHTLDASRCVACMNCIDQCKRGAIRFTHASRGVRTPDAQDVSPENTASATCGEGLASPERRGLLLALPAMLVANIAHAQTDKTRGGGLAELQPRRTPQRTIPVKPAGAISLKNFTTRCTACQLCVAACPNGVLRPSASLRTLMQPEMHFDKGFCRPECTACADVCPSGAIKPVSRAEKTTIQAGVAVWTAALCLPANQKDKCGNCSRHCPNGAIIMIEQKNDDGTTYEIPSVNTERCMGCGACEYVCPVRPVSAIHVEGVEIHGEI